MVDKPLDVGCMSLRGYARVSGTEDLAKENFAKLGVGLFQVFEASGHLKRVEGKEFLFKSTDIYLYGNMRYVWIIVTFVTLAGLHCNREQQAINREADHRKRSVL